MNSIAEMLPVARHSLPVRMDGAYLICGNATARMIAETPPMKAISVLKKLALIFNSPVREPAIVYRRAGSAMATMTALISKTKRTVRQSPVLPINLSVST